MIKIKNIQTGEVINVSDVMVNNDGKIFARFNRPEPNEKFFSSKPFMRSDETIHDEQHNIDCRVIILNDGWELASGTRQNNKRTEKGANEEKKSERNPRAPKQSAEVVDVHPSNVADSIDEVVENVTNNTPDEDSNEQALIAAIKNLRGGAVDSAKVREIVAEELSKLLASDAKKAAKVIEAAKKKSGKKNEIYCAKFQRIVAKVSRGNNVYLYGPAGSGKSHTAEQVADALGLDFYGQTTIQFAHDVRGYGDAGGNFQETPFFKAFANGGLYFQDEYDRSNAEAAIVLNSALANGWYDFPIVGRVEAHPNFRFMAAGNTLMTGADEEYVTGQEIDASSRDRFAYFFEVDYNHDVELRIAHGHEDIVSFVEDVRQAIKETGIKHVVSYRATAAMIDEVENENDLIACCDESVFKTLDVDARREIYERLNDKTNVWAKALKKLI